MKFGFNKFYLFFIVIIIIGSGAVLIFRNGWHPVAVLNNKIIWGWQLEREYQAAYQYYNQAVKTYKISGISEIGGDLRIGAFNNLIEKALISENFQHLTGNDRGDILDAKISHFLEDPKLEAAALALFNLSMSEFTDLVLVPQAEKEIISEALINEGRDFDEWLGSKKKESDIYILNNEFEWNGEQLVRRN